MEALTIRESQSLQAQAITEEMYQRFINYLDASPKTIETYKRAIRQFIKYIASAGIIQPTREDIIAFRDNLKATCKPTTVQNYIIAVRLFFQWTEQEGLYPNIAQHIKGAKLTKEHKKDYLTSSQVKAVLEGIERDTPQGRRDFAIFTLMITGGLRDIEVSRANIEDLGTEGESKELYLNGKDNEA